MCLCVLRILVRSNNERYVKADVNRISKHAFVSMAKFEENKRVKRKQKAFICVSRIKQFSGGLSLKNDYMYMNKRTKRLLLLTRVQYRKSAYFCCRSIFSDLAGEPDSQKYFS